ncbi:hypothetical protein [Herbidospora cretacea]|uniref:hypothetical protein n=1 Tax=Herbidospora cretacea TaxID=28444 RepID=UPI0012FAC9BB|nr:hypothetical protein [Herbidospora cretacea]
MTNAEYMPLPSEWDAGTQAGQWLIKWMWRNYTGLPGALVGSVNGRRIASIRKESGKHVVTYHIPAPRGAAIDVSRHDTLKQGQGAVGVQWLQFTKDIGAVRA